MSKGDAVLVLIRALAESQAKGRDLTEASGEVQPDGFTLLFTIRDPLLRVVCNEADVMAAVIELEKTEPMPMQELD